MNSREKSLTIFALFGDFVQQLSIYFDVKSNLKDELLIKLALYDRLIEKTGPTNIEPINKHLNAFNTWVNNNMDACINSDVLLLNDEYPNIVYSENVYIPLNNLLQKISKQQSSEKDVLTLMWKHILNIAFRLTSNEDLKTRLLFLYSQKSQENTTSSDSGRNSNREEQLIEQTIDDIKQELDSMGNVTNVKDAIVHMTKSGAFEKLLDNFTSNMDNKELNLGKMFNIVMQKGGMNNVNMSGLGTVMNMMGVNNTATSNEESIMFDDFNDVKQIK